MQNLKRLCPNRLPNRPASAPGRVAPEKTKTNKNPEKLLFENFRHTARNQSANHVIEERW